MEYNLTNTLKGWKVMLAAGLVSLISAMNLGGCNIEFKKCGEPPSTQPARWEPESEDMVPRLSYPYQKGPREKDNYKEESKPK